MIRSIHFFSAYRAHKAKSLLGVTGKINEHDNGHRVLEIDCGDGENGSLCFDGASAITLQSAVLMLRDLLKSSDLTLTDDHLAICEASRIKIFRNQRSAVTQLPVPDAGYRRLIGRFENWRRIRKPLYVFKFHPSWRSPDAFFAVFADGHRRCVSLSTQMPNWMRTGSRFCAGQLETLFRELLLAAKITINETPNA